MSLLYEQGSMVLVDIAQAIQNDAKDTVTKLTEFFDVMSDMYQLHDFDLVNDSFDVPGTLFQTIFDYFRYGKTIPMSNGEIVCLQSVMPPASYMVYLNYVKGSTLTPFISINYLENKLTVMSNVIKSQSNTNITVQQLMDDIADAIATESAFARITSLITSGSDVNFQTLNDLLTGINPTPNTALGNFISSLRDLGTATSATSILALMAKSYERALTGQPELNDSRIRFNDTDYAVKDIVPTVIADLAVTATQLIATLAIAFGTPAMKLLGFVFGAGGAIAKSLWTVLNQTIGTQASYTSDAPYCNYAQPIAQEVVQWTNVDPIIQNLILEQGVLRLDFPGMIAFVWQNPDNSSELMLEAYLNLVYETPVKAWDHYIVPQDPDPIYTSFPLFITHDTGNDYWVHGVPPVDSSKASTSVQYAYNWTDALSEDARYSVYSGKIWAPTDAESRKRVCDALTWAFNFVMQRPNRDFPQTDTGLILYGFTTYVGDTYQDFTPGDASAFTRALHNLTLLFKRVAYDPLYESASPDYPSGWGDIQNRLVMALKYVISNGGQANFSFFGRYLASVDTATGTGYPGRVIRNAMGAPMTQLNPVVAPPEYDYRAFWTSVGMITAAAVAIVTTAMIFRFTIGRRIDKRFLEKKNYIEQLKYDWEKETDPGQRKIIWDNYIAAIKDYNKWATLLFRSKIDWATGEIASNSFASISTVQDTVTKMSSKLPAAAGSTALTLGNVYDAIQEIPSDLTDIRDSLVDIDNGVSDVTKLIKS